MLSTLSLVTDISRLKLAIICKIKTTIIAKISQIKAIAIGLVYNIGLIWIY
jgi:hypothetical protein